MAEYNTPASRLEWFVKQRYRIKSDFAKELGMSSWAAMAKYIGKGDKSVLGIQYLSQFPKVGLDVYWYLTGEWIDNSKLYRGDDISIISNVDRVENLHKEQIRVLTQDNLEKAILKKKENELIVD